MPSVFRIIFCGWLNYQALRQYTPQVYPGRVCVFRARVRPLFRLHEPDLGWRGLAAGGLEVITVPGNHDTMLREPRVRVLAAQLRAALQKARERGPGATTTGSSRQESTGRSPAARG
jgi:thioesterase domain-containing protein